MKNKMRHIPPIHEFQKDERFSQLLIQHEINEQGLTSKLKSAIQLVRQSILDNGWEGPEPDSAAFKNHIFNELDSSINRMVQYTLRKVINGTGTILHTNLGRSRLSKRAIAHMLEIAGSYSNLEYNIAEGRRGSRHDHIEGMIKQVTDAESAMVVNNNAAAVYLILKALASEREVIVSRGQLVEIGGSFRVSSIMEESGANLVEVGTTNKTHIEDYQKVINEETAMIMKVHTSNFKVIGFTQTVEANKLAQLASENNILFYEDLGSGVLSDLSENGTGQEPVVKEVIGMGADIVSFSGDKLLGGPQAGIIAGKKKFIDVLKKHQLARVLRVDKMTLAALEGTLIDYVKGNQAINNIPVIRDIRVSRKELQLRSERFIRKLHALTSGFITSIVETTGKVGGGAMPEVELPSIAAAIKHQRFSVEEMANFLRVDTAPSIIVRIQKAEILIDLRTVSEEEEEVILLALTTLSKK
ncbi:L-seryl-tRNA(Sec) selenium transferase [Cytobacillus purgationiresistens]|uniref:L-seryl-tRNA(Sec) selenium transferase n=1 Tax=Cytobacillus purgationiresistens TaxID=863449 RepID=A0ABU0AHS0_9BACI|nr:L-seryl-tRNA(Sec) selenium transferase [Cytobacillus purgationiresistens]MDQ0269615.1 L-seryl-tRNA(Ser) seleniumtransferase [Cytobacillus purgationiresistens]